MRAVILAAGEGKRLMPLTADLPKCLVPIAGRPILHYQMEALKDIFVSELVVVTGAHSEKIEDHLQSSPLARSFSARTVKNEKYKETNVLASFGRALETMPDAQDTILMASDVILEPSVLKKLSQDCPRSELVLCVNRKECGAEEVKVRVNDDLVEKLGKDLDPAGCYGEFLGVLLIRKSLFETVREVTNQMLAVDAKAAYLFNMINRLIEKSVPIGAAEIGAAVSEDVDCLEDLQRVEAKWLSMKTKRAE